MSKAANVTSLEVLRAFKPALLKFEQEVQNALISLDLESRRPADWIERDRSRYWPNEARKASDLVSECRTALSRAETNTSGEARYCYDERKALERAKRRMQLAEEKIQAVRLWRVKIRREIDEFQVQVAKLKNYMESDFLRALATLQQMSDVLGKYVDQQASSATSGGGTP